ncbi:DUF3397 domain-containing protein [Lentilactobacillus diolivorans]|nr:DUF3397 domain-containing protein [Lentilactobacillus diolivorans]GEP24009.1 hypothetical protein LDI01_16020 [Lentilactobacillus diolivorans]
MHVSLLMTNIAIFLGQLLVLLIVAGIVISIKKKVLTHHQVRMTPVDFWPPILLLFIHQISINGLSNSLLPQVVVIWIGISLLILFWQIFSNQELTYKKFFVIFWRFGDLIVFISWVGVVIYVIYQSL